jgi:hypothetical protein
MTTTFENAKVGDRVYSLATGWGEIERIDDWDYYSIRAKFNCAVSHLFCGFTRDGKIHRHGDQVLFWDKPTIVAPAKPEPKREAPPVDTLVEVKKNDGTFVNRYSAGELNEDGYLRCWSFGATSKTAEQSTQLWTQEWRVIPQPDKDGWIEWKGGECPVPTCTVVDVKQRCGKIILNQMAWGRNRHHNNVNAHSKAGHAFWRNDGSISDIIAYRIAQ